MLCAKSAHLALLSLCVIIGHYAYGVIYCHQFILSSVVRPLSSDSMLYASNVLKILSDWTLPHSEPGVNEKFVDAGLHRP
jgi:hypothetical protein